MRKILLALAFIAASVASLLYCIARPLRPKNASVVARIYAALCLPAVGAKSSSSWKSPADAARPTVYVCNHQSNYDLFVVGKHVPPGAVALGKVELKWVPLFGQIFWLSGNIFVRRGDSASAKTAMSQAASKLAAKHPRCDLWFFPEGHRNKGKGLLPFKQGAFRLAIEAGADVRPVCASSYAAAAASGEPFEARVEFLEPIPTAGMAPSDAAALMERVRAAMEEGIAKLDADLSTKG